MEASTQLQMYSISAAAKVLHLGKDTVYSLIAAGKIGYISIGKRKKIPYQELVRFQSDTVKRLPEQNCTSLMTKPELEKFFNISRTRKPSLNGKEILKSLMR